MSIDFLLLQQARSAQGVDDMHGIGMTHALQQPKTTQSM
jgi:hypothetical protein